LTSQGRAPLASAEAFAQDLLSEYVDNPDMNAGDELPAESGARRRYLDAKRLYRLALVLVVLLAEEERRPVMLRVREGVEALVFSPQAGDKEPRVSALRAAMRDLGELLSLTGGMVGRPLSWSRAWFERVGVVETNPVRLTTFAVGWMDAFTALVEVVRGVDIE
jgi:hypothetical protein